MTITTNSDRDEYTASGGQTVFSYTFKIYADSDLNVYQTAVGQTPDDSMDLITAYTVAGAGLAAGGSITLTTPATAGDLITIVSDIPSSRTTDYQDSGDYTPDTVNEDHDRHVSLNKQAEGIARRSALFPQSFQDVSEFSLPSPVAGKFWQVNSGLTGMDSVDPPAATVTDGLVSSRDYTTLRAITGQAADESIMVGYRATKGDNGGGQFLWDSSDLSTEVTADPQSGIYVAPNSDATGTSGAWVRVYDGDVNLAWFNSSDVGATINALTAAGTTTVYIPRGTYTQSTELTSNQELYLYSDYWDEYSTQPAIIVKNTDIRHIKTNGPFTSLGIRWDGGNIAGGKDGLEINGKIIFIGQVVDQTGNGM
jgi:hypothetical protein